MKRAVAGLSGRVRVHARCLLLALALLLAPGCSHWRAPEAPAPAPPASSDDGGQSSGAEGSPSSRLEVSTFPRVGMAVGAMPLATLDQGAVVPGETKVHAELPPDAPGRVRYDTDTSLEVAEGVWTLGSPDVVNLHAVQAPEGLIVFDTGSSPQQGRRYWRMLRSIAAPLPIRAIVYTNLDGIYGAAALQAQDARRGNDRILVLGRPDLNRAVLRAGGPDDGPGAHPELEGVLAARAARTRGFYLPEEGPDAAIRTAAVRGFEGFVPVDTPTPDGSSLSVAGLELEFRSVEVGDDLLNLVWIPSRRLLVQDVVRGGFPEIAPQEGGAYRNPRDWIEAVDLARQLQPEILLGARMASVTGEARVRDLLDAYRDALAFVLDQSLKGALLGLDAAELGDFVVLPPHLLAAPILRESRGRLPRAAARIHAEALGAGAGDAAGADRLHPVEEAQRLVNAMGGPERVAELSREADEQGDVLWACQLAHYLVAARERAADRALAARCLRRLGQLQEGAAERSWYLTAARALEQRDFVVSTLPPLPAWIEAGPGPWVDAYRVRIAPERAASTDALLELRFGEDAGTFGLHVRRGVVDFIASPDEFVRQPDLGVELSPAVFARIFLDELDPADAIADGRIRVLRGSPARAAELFALFDPIYDWQNDTALQLLRRRLPRTFPSP